MRYFLGKDNSGHDYLVEADKLDEWESWTNLSEDDEASWNVPTYAKEIGGSLHRLTFVDPTWA